MAGKRGWPRKALALQRGSIVSRRGTIGVFEQIQTEGEEVVDCFAETSRDLGDRLAEEMVDLGDLGNTGGGGEKVVVVKGESIAPAVDLKGKLPLQSQMQAGLSGGRREGVYLAAVQRGPELVVSNMVRPGPERGECGELGGFQCKEWKVKEVQGSQTTGLGVQEVSLCFGGQTVGSSSREGAVQKVANEDKWQIVRGHGSRGGQACLSTGQITSQRWLYGLVLQEKLVVIGKDVCRAVPNFFEKEKMLTQELRETTDHILFECKFSSAVMHRVLQDVELCTPRGLGGEWFSRVTIGKTTTSESTEEMYAAVVYFLWQERNSRVFHISTSSSAEDTCGSGLLLPHGWDGLEAPSCRTASFAWEEL
ncbi:hypothetical protein Dimus_034113 [Dionaea muscipula]